MTIIEQHLEKAEKELQPNQLMEVLLKYVKSIEDDVFDLNVRQLEDGKDAFGKDLKNKNKKYSGVYSNYTALIAKKEKPILPKVAGKRYNFGWTGDYLKSFEMNLYPDRLEVINTREGSGTKKDFFDGYKDKYGLTKESLSQLIQDKILPFMQNHVRKTLTG